jgi:hypothetical protein
MDPLPLTARERWKIADALSKIKQAAADLKVIHRGNVSGKRLTLVIDALWDAQELVHELFEDLDVYGTSRRRAAEAPQIRSLPPRQMRLLPAANDQ